MRVEELVKQSDEIFSACRIIGCLAWSEPGQCWDLLVQPGFLLAMDHLLENYCHFGRHFWALARL